MKLMSKITFFLFLMISIFMYMFSLYFLVKDFSLNIEFLLFSMNSSSVNFVIFIDWISLIFSSLVFFISSLVVKYSSEYMSDEQNFSRFMFLVIMFVFSMVLMIMSLNLVSILLGWDGLGLISYALVIFYQNKKSYNSGMLTVLSNRLGDAALLISISLMMNFGGWNLNSYLEFFKNSKIMIILLMFIILASITKSAQIPFSSWLPAAMAAPTPVSSLVHSSTLVTAGVYLLFRFNSLYTENFLKILFYISLLTMFMAGLSANFEFDLKKIIALSTLSQLGMMMLIMCLGNSNLAFFHLFIHALFKALLFMCAGAIIHNIGNFQDIRLMGSLGFFMPLTCVCFTLSNLALCGLPFLSGFYSKDLIIESVSSSFFVGLVTYIVFFFSIGLTVSYSMRLFYYLFFGDLNFLSLNNFNDKNNKIMLKGMLGLVFLVIFKGSLLLWLLFPSFEFLNLPFSMKILTLFMILIGSLMGYLLSKMKFYYMNKSLMLKNIVIFIVDLWNMPKLMTNGLNFFILWLSKFYYKNLDLGWMEFYGSKGMFYWMKKISCYLQTFSFFHFKIFLLGFSLIFFFFFIKFMILL